MTRWKGPFIGLIALAASGMTPAPPAARAGGQEGRDRHVPVFRFSGGARLGVSLEEVSAEEASRARLAEARGARVTSVTKDSAAEKAGLREGDIVLSYNGEKVWSVSQLRRLVRETPAGRTVALEVNRAGAPQRLSATLEKGDGNEVTVDGDFSFDVPVPPVPPVPPLPPLFEEGAGGRRFLFRDFLDARPGRLGLTYQALSAQLARYFKAPEGALLVSEVAEDGPAARAGVQAGDVIVKVDGKAVEGGDVLRRAVRAASDGGEVALTLQREGRPLEVKVGVRGAERPARRARPTV
jgi:serine protease Do